MELIRLGAGLVEAGMALQLRDRFEKLTSARETADRRLQDLLTLQGQLSKAGRVWSPDLEIVRKTAQELLNHAERLEPNTRVVGNVLAYEIVLSMRLVLRAQRSPAGSGLPDPGAFY